MKKAGSLVRPFPGKLDFDSEEKKEEDEFGGQANKQRQEDFSDEKKEAQIKNKEVVL